jgi:hypothetical protein
LALFFNRYDPPASPSRSSSARLGRALHDHRRGSRVVERMPKLDHGAFAYSAVILDLPADLHPI